MDHVKLKFVLLNSWIQEYGMIDIQKKSIK